MPGKSLSARLFVLVAVGIVGAAAARRAAAQAAPVVVAPVIERDITVGQTFVGTVEPTRRSIVGSAVDGRVVRVPVEEGDFVEGPPAVEGSEEPVASKIPVDTETAVDNETLGQTLVELRTGTIDIMIAGAKAEQTLRERELDEMNAGTRPKELEQRQAEYERALALRDYAKKRYDRLESLNRATTREEVEQSYSSWIAAEQNLKASEAAVALAQEGPRQEQKDQAAARLQMQKEAVELLNDRRKKYTIRAPFEGYVVAKHTEVGAWIQTGDPVAEVIQIDPVQVTVAVPESYIGSVSRGSAVTVQFDGLEQRMFHGDVFRVIPQADVRSRTFPVTARLANPQDEHGDHVIKVGMLAHATIGQRHRAVLVPKDALVLGGPKPIVYATTGAVQAGQEAAVRPVTVEIGVAYGDLSQVSGDLQPGQAVVVEGNERLRGDKIRVLKVLPASETN
jgi:multidrug efflux pump subunit AcrA (membrane-fusion protein)